MANVYAPRQFLRHTKITLLQKYFSKRNLLGHIEWENLQEANVEPVFAALEGLTESERDETERDFREIHEMGTADGTRAIIEEGQFHGLDMRAVAVRSAIRFAEHHPETPRPAAIGH